VNALPAPGSITIQANASSWFPGFLRSLPLFAALSATSFATLVRGAQCRSYARNARIVQAGDVSSGLFVLVAGRARLFVENATGAQLTIEILRANAIFGELGALDGEAAFSSVVALQPCEVLHEPRDLVRTCIAAEPDAAVHLLRHTLKRLRGSYWTVANLGLFNVYTRVARVLLENASGATGEIVAEPGSEELARMVGASREMVSRVLKSMIDRGLIRRERRTIVILDSNALAHAEYEVSPKRARFAHGSSHTPDRAGPYALSRYRVEAKTNT